ncbi:MAG: ribosomal protein S18-alanine N-acetyltransferase [Nitrospirota bacterium]
MRKEDLDQVLAIEQASFTMPWSRNLFLSEFRNAPVSLMLVAHSSLEPPAIIGYIVCWIVADELHILDLATEPTQRRKGIARHLVLAALKYAYERSVRRAFLEVRASNDSALNLYEGFGFVRSIVRKGYYDLPVEDAVVMSLDQEGLQRLVQQAAK